MIATSQGKDQNTHLRIERESCKQHCKWDCRCSSENIQNKWLLYKKMFMKRYPKHNQNQLTRTVVLEVFNAVALKY